MVPARSFRTWVEAGSLVLGALLMSIGDLVHPEEDLEAANQVALLIDDASRWYTAHLLLFIGILLFVPGVLALTDLASARRSSLGYATKILFVISLGGLGAIFAFEMVLGRFMVDGADSANATLLLDTFQSGNVFGAIGPAALTFFVASGLLVYVLGWPSGPLRWPAVVFGLGAAFILAEILSAEVLLSQVGSVMVVVASAWFAWLILSDRETPRLAN